MQKWWGDLFRPASSSARRARPRRTAALLGGSLDDLERRALLSGVGFDSGTIVDPSQADVTSARAEPKAFEPPDAPAFYVPNSPEYYPEAIPISNRSSLDSTNPLWNSALVYQYGPDPAQVLWVFVPSDPSGRLDLIAHSGGFEHGSPADDEIDDLAERDLAAGTTVVSIGYRLLGDTGTWPEPVYDIAKGIDDGVDVAQSLTGNRITDITETGLSAGGTALALINYSPDFPSTVARPNRIITISAPLELNTAGPHIRANPIYRDSLDWKDFSPKSDVPITLMGTVGDPIAGENAKGSTIHQFAHYLMEHGVPAHTYLNPHNPGHHGRTAEDFVQYPDVAAALDEAYNFDG